MRKAFFAWVVLVAAVLAGCGGGGSGPRTLTGQVLSSQRSDGDIVLDTGIYTITPAATSQSLLYGLGPANEYRAFMTFPLDGSGGGSVIPVDARVVAADVELHVNRCDLASIPTLLDLVAYPVGGPTPADFNSLPLTASSFSSFNVFSTDVNNFVRIDVTPLVQEAIAQGRNEVQFRLLTDTLSTAVGLVGIDDGAAGTAPLLTITYQ